MSSPIYRRYGKRCLDVVAAASGLLILFPVLVVTSVLVGFHFGQPLLFRQVRPGKGGRAFKVLKFRTMTNQCDHAGNLLPDDQRLTPFGQWLRTTSLDELPELWNVLVGDMSLVGPRPLLMSYLTRYTPEQARRHEVRPGLTGLAQVSGRNLISWEQRFELDIQYVDELSFIGDLRIIARTLVAVVSRQGIAAEGHVTMHEFLGTVDPYNNALGFDLPAESDLPRRAA